VGSIVAGAFPVVLLLGLVALFLVTNKRKLGQWIWEQRRLKKHGVSTSAKVLARVDRGYTSSSGRVAYHRYELVVMFTLPTRASQRSQTTIELMAIDSTTAAEGTDVPIWYDPARPDVILLDIDAIEAAKAAERAKKLAADDERVKALMRK
jgi:hypothetical protein